MRTLAYHPCTSLLLIHTAGVQAEASSAEQLQPACKCISGSSTLISFLLARDPVGKGRNREARESSVASQVQGER